METQTILMRYIKDELLRGRMNDLDAEDDLLSSGVINSLGILQLVSFVEKRMGIEIPDEDVVYENFHSVAALTNYLQDYEQGSG